MLVTAGSRDLQLSQTGNPTRGGDSTEKKGSPPSPRYPGASTREGKSWVKPRRHHRKRGGNASRLTPQKLTAKLPCVAPPNPVSLTKATAASAHHLVSPNPSLKHKTRTTHLSSFLKLPPGIKFRVAATTRHDEYRYTGGGLLL